MATPEPVTASQPSALHLGAVTTTIITGCVSLVAFSGILLFGTAVVGITQQPAACILPLAWAVPWAAEIIKEFRVVLGADRAKQAFNAKADSLTILLVVAGAVVTFWINSTLGRGPIVASAVVCALSSATMKTMPPAIPLGSYVGMSSPVVFDYWLIAVAGAIAGLAFVSTKHSFNGFGGKIGTCAWVGCIISSQIGGRTLPTGKIIAWSTGWLLILYCGVGASLTHLLNHRFKQGPVMASTIIGVLGWAVLPMLHPDYPSLDIGVFTASFVGMSGLNRCSQWYHAMPPGLLCGYFIMYYSPFMQGAGGKLGAAALASVLGYKALLDVGTTLLSKRERNASGPAVEVFVGNVSKA